MKDPDVEFRKRYYDDSHKIASMALSKSNWSSSTPADSFAPVRTPAFSEWSEVECTHIPVSGHIERPSMLTAYGRIAVDRDGRPRQLQS